MELHKSGKLAAGLIVLMMFLSGCGSDRVLDAIERNIENTSIIVEKDGRVMSHTVGVFDKDYYDLEGLRKMAQEEVAAYNTANQKTETTPVLVDRVEMLADQPGKVVVTYSYDSPDTYTAYHGEELFFGTVSQAVDAGYSFVTSPQTLRDARGSATMVSSQLHDGTNAQKHILITKARALIYCPYKVEYVSEQATLREDGSVDALGLQEDDAPVIILMKK